MPKPENIDLIASLDAAISRLAEASLDHPDWEFPFRPFLWEVETQGAFSIEKLFHFQVVSEAEFLETCRSRTHQSEMAQLQQASPNQEARQKYGEFLNLLHGYLAEFEIYTLSFSGVNWEQFYLNHPGLKTNVIPAETSSLPITTFEFEGIILGRSYGDYWIGIGKVPDYYGYLYSSPSQETLSRERADLIDQQTLEFVNELNPVLQFLPQNYVWNLFPTRDGALRRILSATRIVYSNEFDRFESRRLSWAALSQASQTFIQELQSLLTGVYEHRLFDRYTYLIGQTDWGDWAGVWTQDSFNP